MNYVRIIKKIKGQVFQINDNNRKVLFNKSQMTNMIALSLTIKKLGAVLKFFESKSKVTIKVM